MLLLMNSFPCSSFILPPSQWEAPRKRIYENVKSCWMSSVNTRKNGSINNALVYLVNRFIDDLWSDIFMVIST